MKFLFLCKSKQRFVGRQRALGTCSSGPYYHFPVGLASVLKHPHRMSQVVDHIVLWARDKAMDGYNTRQVLSLLIQPGWDKNLVSPLLESLLFFSLQNGQ